MTEISISRQTFISYIEKKNGDEIQPIRLLLLLFCFSSAHGKIHYPLINHPIDVVIPCHEKDLPLLPYCIEGAKNNIEHIRRVIVISKERYTDEAEWCDEKHFPFTKEEIANLLLKNYEKGAEYAKNGERLGWYYQQLLKLYAPFIIPEISENVLIIDSDTVFLSPVSFLNKEKGGYYCPAMEYHTPYFLHLKRLLRLKRVWKEYSGVSHHMLFQRPILEDLFSKIEKIHHMQMWQAFCYWVNPRELFSGASEYELYFNFVFSQTDQVSLRSLKHANIGSIEKIEDYKKEGYDFISCHHWMRQ